LKYQSIPALSGFELIKILKKDGWIEHRRTTHGIALKKRIEDRTRVTIVPKTRATLPTGTLMAIMGEKLTGLGRSGLLCLLNRYK